MSYRELRNFCEIMRALGYPRLISMENFRNPNFELVADILFWLAHRYDPGCQISDDIDDEKARIEFIKQIATLFATKTRIKLNTKKLYGSDGYAVKEILKIATILYKAYTSPPPDEEEFQGFQLPAKLGNVKAHRQIANEITEIGVKLFDQIKQEPDCKLHRDKALAFLDNISRNLESNSEQAYIEKCVKDIIGQQDNQIDEMQKYVTNLEKDQRTLEEKIRKRTLEVERGEKKLKLLQNMKPAYMEEYERFEAELERVYSVYVEKFRNLDYLEHQLDIYYKLEQKKFQDSQEAIKKRWDKVQQEEHNQLLGKEDINEALLEQQLADSSSRGQSRGDSRRGMQNQGNQFRNKDKMNGGFKNYDGFKQPKEEEEDDSEVEGEEADMQDLEGSNDQMGDSVDDDEF